MTPEQEERRAAAWEQTRAKGKKNYILRTGVLQWGGIMFVAMTTFSFYNRPPNALMGPVGLVVINLIVWPIGGYFFGLIMWHLNEAWMNKLRARKP